MPAPLTAILIGAGQRGADSYAPYALAHPDRLRFVAVAEPIPERREHFASQHSLAPQQVYESWEPLLQQPQLAEAALVCTQDTQHTGPALAALRAGYQVLLEKPMATTPEECRLLVETAEETGRQLHIAHVLRYTPHFQKIRQILRSGVLGQIIHVAQNENVSFWHMAHSYVRGNWNNQARSSPMILAKCCHDLDILLWLFEEPAAHISSVGNLRHYRPDNAPPGAPDYCLDGCPVANECPFYAPFIYVDLLPLWRSFAHSSEGVTRRMVELYLRNPGLVTRLSAIVPSYRQLGDYRGWPCSVVCSNPTTENLLAALKDGPYGRCVYRCDNDVVDHQVVSMEFPSGITAALTMQGHSNEEHRFTRIEGSHATLTAYFGIGGAWVEVNEHRTGNRSRSDTSAPTGEGHGGGDFALMEAFLHCVRTGGEKALTTARQALESHLMAFAAEQARVERRVILRSEYAAGD